MGKKKPSGPSGGRGSAQAGLIAIDPLEVRFTHSRIRPQFSCGRRVEDTLKEICDGKISVADLPPITLLSNSPGSLEPPYFSLNNRRLFVMKELRKRGIIKEVMARVKPPVDSKRENERYTVEKCSLTAKLMGMKEERKDDCEEDEEGSQEEVEKPKKADKFPMDWKKTIGDVTVYGVDGNSLLPKKWVRDPVISAYLDFLEKNSPVKVIHPPVSLLINHTKDPSPLPEGYFIPPPATLLVPVNNSTSPESAVSGSHWSLLAYTHSTGTWTTYDSSASVNDSVAAALAKVLHPLLSSSDFTVTQGDCPQQQNNSDCGVHLMINAANCAGVSCPTDPTEMRRYLFDMLWDV